MSISLILLRLTPTGYDHARTTGTLNRDIDAENQEIDKHWGILERILAGDTTPPGFAARAITGGNVLPGMAGDYGGMRLIYPGDVADISAALQRISDAEIEHRCATLDFTGVYSTPGSSLRGDEEVALWAFHSLRDFYAETAAKGLAIAVGRN